MVEKQQGQILVLLILVITIALATGLSIIQKSISDISTASRVEQSTRAFSAAEAGIEQTLRGGLGAGITFAGNNSQATISDQGLQPPLPAGSTQQAAIEFSSLAKEDTAQIWLADFNSTTNPPAVYYNPSSAYKQIYFYWGNSSSDKAALEVSLLYFGKDSSDPDDPNTDKYRIKKRYFEQDSTRRQNNRFELTTCSGNNVIGSTTYRCRQAFDFSYFSTLDTNYKLMLIRARLLYNNTSQPLAVQPFGTCGKDCSFPPQMRVIYSVGVSGETQRRIKVTQQEKVAPRYLDYVIFSSGTIIK